jgi:hypothetical protein
MFAITTVVDIFGTFYTFNCEVAIKKNAIFAIVSG